MRITDVYVGYLKITRIIQIGSILVKHGFKEMISHTFLGRRIRKRRIRQHKPVYTTQERLRLTIEDLGPTYIKFGQILADRPDILSERFRKELKKLQTNALPFDDHLAIRLIEDELGAEIKDVFSEFNPHCIASASIGQVYTGRLKNGKDVVIKIRRPNIDQKIKLDLYLMRYLAKKLALEYPEMAAINIVGVPATASTLPKVPLWLSRGRRGIFCQTNSSVISTAIIPPPAIQFEMPSVSLWAFSAEKLFFIATRAVCGLLSLLFHGWVVTENCSITLPPAPGRGSAFPRSALLRGTCGRKRAGHRGPG